MCLDMCDSITQSVQVEDALLAGVREWFNFVMEAVPREVAGGQVIYRNFHGPLKIRCVFFS